MAKYASQETFYNCLAGNHKITLNECVEDRHENMASRWTCPTHDHIVHVEYDGWTTDQSPVCSAIVLGK